MTDKQYTFLDLHTVNEPYADELKDAAIRVIESGRYIGGAEVEALENDICRLTGARNAVGVSNGLDALRLIFKAYIKLGHLNEGDGVIVPANTFIASVLAITDAGLVPVFAEPSPHTLNLDTDRLEEFYNPAVRAVLTVHLYGRPCYDTALKEFAKHHNLIVVEDNAQAIGAEVPSFGMTGNLGDAAAFSFYPTKNVGALGDAGAVTTSDGNLAGTVRALANYGSDRRYHNIYRGYNCRLDPIQAAFLRVKLPHLERENEHRRAVAAVYDSVINNPLVTKPLISCPDYCVWHQYVVRVKNRETFRKYLEYNGIETDIHYPVPPHRQPCYADYSHISLPVADMLGAEVVSLPISSCTSTDDARAIARIINEFS